MKEVNALTHTGIHKHGDTRKAEAKNDWGLVGLGKHKAILSGPAPPLKLGTITGSLYSGCRSGPEPLQRVRACACMRA